MRGETKSSGDEPRTDGSLEQRPIVQGRGLSSLSPRPSALCPSLAPEIRLLDPVAGEECLRPIGQDDPAGEPVLTWKLARALAIKFKAADLNARGTEVGVEELHLAHEGLTLVDTPAGSR